MKMELSHYLCSLLVLAACYAARRLTRTTSKLPPSPPGHPVLGHALKIPQSQTWKAFAEWGKLYGPVIFAKVLGRSMIIVNSVAAARDLMEKKSVNFSDRPRLVLLGMIGWDVILATLPYGSPQFRQQRRWMQQYLGPSAVRSYDDIVEENVRKFLHRLLVSPDNSYKEVHGHVASIVVKAVYGHDVSGNPADDPLIKLNEQALNMTTATGSVGATFIDFFPFLRHVPAWVPGMGLKRKALEIRELMQIVFTSPFEDVKSQKAAGTATLSVLYRLLDEYEGRPTSEEEANIKNFAGTFYNAGTDTTRTVLQMFFLMMVLNPEVQRRAQKEIDQVVGPERLPSFSDKASLPYIDCVMKEVLRIHPPIPLGVPHLSNHKDEYSGWIIPEKSMVIPNIWRMMRDEESFPDPEEFKPERHIIRKDHEAYDSVAPVFGFGRRFCPGRVFAESIMWITIASVLAAFDILPCMDPVTGKEILPVVEFESEIVNSIKPFKCRVVPRKERLTLITREH
ncbi:hypothetical protein ACEPAF_5581 [Sanghuangporus sanghuang]